jgi:hypothetical protein
MYVRTCMYVCTYALCMYVCMYYLSCILSYIHTYIIHTYTHKHMCESKRACMRSWMCVYIHIYSVIYMNVCTTTFIGMYFYMLFCFMYDNVSAQTDSCSK